MIALGCLDKGDERGEGQGLLLKSSQLRARYGYCDKVERRDETWASTVVVTAVPRAALGTVVK